MNIQVLKVPVCTLDEWLSQKVVHPGQRQWYLHR